MTSPLFRVSTVNTITILCPSFNTSMVSCLKTALKRLYFYASFKSGILFIIPHLNRTMTIPDPDEAGDDLHDVPLAELLLQYRVTPPALGQFLGSSRDWTEHLEELDER